MQLSFYFDQAACIGCGECEQICKSERNLQDIESFRRVVTIEENDEVNNLSYSCYHCAKPACADACPVGAIYKREEDGIVLMNSDKCAAARKDSICTGIPCKEACPYNIPQISSGNAEIMRKCDMCITRLEQGEKPWCVIMCPLDALDIGPMEELTAKYGSSKTAAGFEYHQDVGPSIVLTAG